MRRGSDDTPGETIHVRVDPDGESREYTKRRPVTYMKNGRRSNDFLQINVRMVTLVATLIGSLGVIGGALMAGLKWVVVPEIRNVVEEMGAPTRAKLLEQEALVARNHEIFRQHVIDAARMASDYPTRVELRDDLAEIKADLRAIRDRQR